MVTKSAQNASYGARGIEPVAGARGPRKHLARVIGFEGDELELSHACDGGPFADLPHEIMADVGWSFLGEPFDSMDEFLANVGPGQANRIATHVVLPAASVRIAYSHWRGSEEVDEVVELTSEHEGGFTGKELLFKLHNAVVLDLRDDDHHFFQGLILNTRAIAEQPPLYVLWLGS